MSMPGDSTSGAPSPAVDRTAALIRARIAAWRRAGDTVALVPTMGALHRGHLSLVADARRRARRVVVSIFVNPTQFAQNEDFATYPRDEAADLEKLAAERVDAVFAPADGEMYAADAATTVSVAGPAIGLESEARPHFFGGVATVVTKLLCAALPDVAIFGEKDFQQLAVIRRMVVDLFIPVEIIGHPTVREDDGLALSSRNAYLSDDQRARAPCLFAALSEAAAAIRSDRDLDAAVACAYERLSSAGFRPDYVAARNAETLAPVLLPRSEPVRLLAAAWLGRTRLIDNLAV